MPMVRQSLSDIASTGLNTALKETTETLSQAFDPTSPEATEELHSFISTVRKWLDDREEGEGALTLWHWVEKQVNPWLHQLDASTIAALAATVPGLHDRIALLGDFFQTPMRSALGQALEATAISFSVLPPQDATAEEQTQRVTSALRLVDMAAVVSVQRDVITLEKVLSHLPATLTEQVFVQAGRLVSFDFYLEEMARVLPLAEPRVTNAFAAAFAGKESLRLRRLLEGLAAYARRPVVAALPTAPSRPQVEEWFIKLRRALAKHSFELQRRVEAFTTALLNHDHEQATILSAYLNARPLNHEDVFELISAHSEMRREGYPPSIWGMPLVMTWLSGSMRSRSIVTNSRPSTRIEPADFDWKPALRMVGEPVLREFILGQTSSEFAISYLSRVYYAGHPDFEMLCANLAANSVFCKRLRVATGDMSAVILQDLDRLRLHAPAMRELYHRLVPELLQEVPAKYLENILHSVLRFNGDFDGNLEQMIKEDIERRFPQVSSVRELESLLKAALTMFRESEELARLLDRVPFHALVPKEDAEDRTLEGWLYVVVRLTAYYLGGEPARRLLSSLPPSLFGRMYTLAPWGPREDDSVHFCELRQALKSLFIEEWARHESDPAQKALHENINRDFELWWRCRFPGNGDEKQLTTSTVFQWLQVVARHCPYRLSAYLSSLLHFAWAVHYFDRFGPYIDDAASFVSAWLGSASETAEKEGLWEVLLARLAALPEDDYESAAALAAVELPAAPGGLAAFRAQAVPEVRKRVSAASTVNWSGSLARLRDRLTRESPELLPLLFAP